LDDLLPLIKSGKIPRHKQDLKAGSYYGGRRPEDGRIDWGKSADEIYNLIRAVTRPYPGAYALTENNEKIIIWWAEPQECNNSATAGGVEISSQDVLVKTGKNAIKFLEIEIQGKCFTGSQIVEYFRQGKVEKIT
jgi:methionyl-tRNA formyltransferase